MAEADGRLACLIQVWEAARALPTAAAERRRRAGGGAGRLPAGRGRGRPPGRPLTRKEVVRALRAAGLAHGPGTVAKALADLTAAGELVNRLDKKGYRLPTWDRNHPTLF